VTPKKIAEAVKKEKASIVDGMNKELQPLYDEARKYKSADDFVDSKLNDLSSVEKNNIQTSN